MCELGMVLGLAAGAARTVGQAQTASRNSAIIRRQARLEHAQHERELLVETNAANKEAYRASLEGDATRAAVVASAGGLSGSTVAARAAEQKRQTALSIANARDRTDAARANYVAAGQHTNIVASNRIAQQQVNPLTAFTNIATSGLQGYGAFR